MLITAIAPEIMVFRSCYQYFDARKLLRQLVIHGGEGWTIIHAQFAMADGIRLLDVHGAMVPNRVESQIKAVKSGKVPELPISAEELSSRSKSDWIVKSIAICQVTWFALQALFRAVKHVQVTALETLTVAFVFCSISIYAFCWNQPQDVEYPIVIRMGEKNANLSQTLEQSDSRFADGQEINWDQHETTDLDTAPNDVSQRRRSWPTSRHGSAVDGAYREGFVEQLAPIADHSNSRSARWNDGDISSAYESGLMLQLESRNRTPLQNMDVSEAGDVEHLSLKSRSSKLKVNDLSAQNASPWPRHPDTDPNTIARLDCIANAGDNHECKPYQNPHLASTLMISGERDLRSSITVVPEAMVVKIDAGVSDLEGVVKPSNSRPDTLLHYADAMSYVILGLLGSLFGAIHCIAWNSPFPTSQERSAWRVCSVAAMCLPFAFTLMLWIEVHTFVQDTSYSDSDLNPLLGLGIISLYAVARITLIVLAFITLRALPADAYQTVNWNSYMPHFGA